MPIVVRGPDGRTYRLPDEATPSMVKRVRERGAAGYAPASRSEATLERYVYDPLARVAAGEGTAVGKGYRLLVAEPARQIGRALADVELASQRAAQGRELTPEHAERVHGMAETATAILGPPPSLTGAATMGATMAAGPLVQLAGRAGLQVGLLQRYPALARTLAATLGGAAGGYAEEGTAEAAGRGALVGGGATAVAEGGARGLEGLARWLLNAKARIGEREAQGIERYLRETVPDFGPVIDRARASVAPTTKGGTTAAALQETALGPEGQRALGDVMERGMLEATLAAGGQKIVSPALVSAWRRLPTGLNAKGQVTNDIAYNLSRRLAPDPQGQFTISQAEELLAHIGDAAFKGEAASPIARHIGGRELRRLYQAALGEVESALPGAAGEIFRGTRRMFAGGQTLLDALRQQYAFRGVPNRVFVDMPTLQRYVSDNRAELLTKLGPADFARLTQAVYRGGQIGTRDLPVAGTGELTAALRETYGRGRGGAPQVVGSAVRVLAPNIGAEYTGVPPYTVPPSFRTLIDLAVQRALTPVLSPAVAGSR